MKATIIQNLLTVLFVCLVVPVHASESTVQLQTLRGVGVQSADPETVPSKLVVDREPVKRNYDKQPPLIPHEVENYKINQTFNKCLECHSWTDAEEGGPTKVSRTHFKDSSSTDDTNLSKRRYYCMLCHVPQTDAKPLVENYFKPAKQ